MEVYFSMMLAARHHRAFSSSVPRRAQNHYEVLGLSVNASANDIKKRFFDLSKRYHPDRNTNADPGKYQQITQAYTVLSNDADRKKFDESLGSAVRKPQGYRSGKTWAGNAPPRRPGTSYTNYNPMKSHRMRQSSNLDPLKPQNQGGSVPHFDFARHARNHLRYDEYRREAQARTQAAQKASGMFRESAASASMGDDAAKDPHAAGATFALRILGITAGSMSLLYLLFR